MALPNSAFLQYTVPRLHQATSFSGSSRIAFSWHRRASLSLPRYPIATPRSLPPSVSAGLAATGTRATSARTSGTSATDEVVETWAASVPSAGWISTRRESNNFSATASSTSGASSGTVSGSACTGADFERSIRSSRRASTFVVEEASLRAYPQAPQNAASAELGAPQTGQGLPGSSLIVNGSHPYREPINVSTWVPSVRAFFPPRD